MLNPFATICYVNEKIRKTLYLPNWIAELLDSEGERGNGPGVIAAAAISLFCRLSDKDKIAALKTYQEEEIEKSYAPNANHKTQSRQQLHNAIGRIKEMLEVEKLQPGTIYRVLDKDEQKVLNEFQKLVSPEGKKHTKTA